MPTEEKNKGITLLAEDGIVFADIDKISDQKDFDLMFLQVKDIVALREDKVKILVHMTSSPLFRTSKFRKRAAANINDLMETIGQVKSAIYAESIIARTISSFIMMASGAKGWKVFDITLLIRDQIKSKRKSHGLMLRFNQENRTDKDWSGYAFVSREGLGQWAHKRPQFLIAREKKQRKAD